MSESQTRKIAREENLRAQRRLVDALRAGRSAVDLLGDSKDGFSERVEFDSQDFGELILGVSDRVGGSVAASKDVSDVVAQGHDASSRLGDASAATDASSVPTVEGGSAASSSSRGAADDTPSNRGGEE